MVIQNFNLSSTRGISRFKFFSCIEKFQAVTNNLLFRFTFLRMRCLMDDSLCLRFVISYNVNLDFMMLIMLPHNDFNVIKRVKRISLHTCSCDLSLLMCSKNWINAPKNALLSLLEVHREYHWPFLMSIVAYNQGGATEVVKKKLK